MEATLLADEVDYRRERMDERQDAECAFLVSHIDEFIMPLVEASRSHASGHRLSEAKDNMRRALECVQEALSTPD